MKLNVPDNELLKEHLSKVFLKDNPALTELNILYRNEAEHNGTFYAEIITCKFKDGQDIKVRCKYMTGDENNQEGRHRGGVIYEARAYEYLFQQSQLSIAHYYGHFLIESTNVYGLVLQYIEGAMNLNQAPYPEGLEKASYWIGFAHSFFENKNTHLINKYNQDYYKNWATNVLNISSGLKGSHPWLCDIATFFIGNIQHLVNVDQTLVHGEYYPNNILYKNVAVYPVDWESAAFGAGEIDLASLTEGYGERDIERVVKIYTDVRWPGCHMHANNQFVQRLNVARLYFHMRWIGRYPSIDGWESNAEKMSKLLKRLNNLKQLSLQLNFN
ncbi:MAG: hypothetical protein M3352_11380 [Bacteroidota bacterium]|nr:hypothetical protein [Bacteroidota bacterium]